MVNDLKFDSTVTISIVLAIVALVAPSITAIINNKHLEKMKKLEIKEQHYKNNNLHIRGMFEQFLTDYGKYMANQKYSDLENLKGSFYSLLPYVPQKDLPVFQEFFDLLVTREAANSEEIIVKKVIPTITKIIGRL